MKFFLSILIAIVCISCKNANQQKVPLLINVTKDIVIPNHYIVTKTKAEIHIDGIANESSWKSALFSKDFIDIEGVIIPKFKTKVKLLWDDDYLYIYSEMEEPHIWGNLKQRDTIIYLNNDFEVFLDPSGTGKNYGEIEINVLGTVWDLFLDKPYRVGGKVNFQWNLNDLKSAVKIHGTLNNPHDVDSLWTVEMAIPLKPLIGLKNKPRTLPKEGEQWRINFSRVQWDYDIIDGKYDRKKENSIYLKEYNWVWSNQNMVNMHVPENWGILQFTEALSSNNIEFIKDEDLQVKQVAFALFRKTRNGNLKHLLENDFGFSQDIKLTYSAGKPLNATFYKTNFGFEFMLKSPNTNKVYIINEQGTLKIL